MADLQDLIEEAQQPAPAAPPPPSSMAAEIKELAGLHAAGALTAEEFAAAKARLLGA